MRNPNCGLVMTLLVAVACILHGVRQAGQAQDQYPPKAEAECTPQELADRFLEVRARLNRPDGSSGMPYYQLGEPVIIELDIRNTSEQHIFRIPSGGLHSAYVVKATEPGGEPVPQTTYGRMVEEHVSSFHQVRLPPRRGFRYFQEFQGGWEILQDPWSRILEPQEQPTQLKIMANLHCDLTLTDDYEIQVQFPVQVFRLDERPAAGKEVEDATLRAVAATPVVMARLAEPLKLGIMSGLFQLQPRHNIISSPQP